MSSLQPTEEKKAEVKTQEIKLQTDLLRPSVRVNSSKDVVLSFSLALWNQKSNSPVIVSQDVVLNSLLEPALLPEASETVESTLNLLALNPFKRLVKKYFKDALESAYKDISSQQTVKKALTDSMNDDSLQPAQQIIEPQVSQTANQEIKAVQDIGSVIIIEEQEKDKK